MQVSDLIARYDVKAILESLAPLYAMFESDKIAKSISAEINIVIGRKYNAMGFSSVKITDVQMRQFLTVLQKEMPIEKCTPPVTTSNQK